MNGANYPTSLLSGYVCRVCSGVYLRGTLACPRCGTFNSLVSVDLKSPPKQGTVAPVRESARTPVVRDREPEESEEIEVVSLDEVEHADFERFESGIWVLDRVLDGGLAYGASILLSGDKGAGKTTLSTRMVMEHLLADRDRVVFLASAEEPLGRFRSRVHRLGYTEKKHVRALKRIHASRETDIVLLLDKAASVSPTLILFDSLRKFTHPDVETSSFLTHGPRVIDEIVSFTEELNCFSAIISRLTKAGKIAGAEDMGYDVDAILNLERHAPKGLKTPYVRLSCEKNRLGSEEVQGWFRKSERGLLCSNGPKKNSGHSKATSE